MLSSEEVLSNFKTVQQLEAHNENIAAKFTVTALQFKRLNVTNRTKTKNCEMLCLFVLYN